MREDDIRRIRQSLDRLGDACTFGRRFHDALAALRPDLQRRLGAGRDASAGGLADLLTALVRRLDASGGPPRIESCGLREDDYDDIGAALLQSLYATFGEGFTPELEQAWAAAYGEVAEATIAAARAPRPGSLS